MESENLLSVHDDILSWVTIGSFLLILVVVLVCDAMKVLTMKFLSIISLARCI